jgi:hypothetical protein
MVLFADQVKLCSRSMMVCEADQAKAVLYILKSALIDFATLLAHIDGKEFPVAGQGTESLAVSSLTEATSPRTAR